MLFGDNAAAGAVNIILKAGEGPPKVTATTTVGSYNFFKPEVMISGKQDRFSYLALASDLDTDGYRHNNAFRAKDLSGNFSFDVNDNLTLKLGHGPPHGRLRPAGRASLVPSARGDRWIPRIPPIRMTRLPRRTTSSILCLRSNCVTTLSSPSGLLTGTAMPLLTYDFGSGSYSDTKSQLQTYAFTPKMVVSTPIGNMKSLFVLGSDYYRYPTTVSSSSQVFRSVPVDKRHREEGLRLLRGREDLSIARPDPGGRLSKTKVNLRRYLPGFRKPRPQPGRHSQLRQGGLPLLGQLLDLRQGKCSLSQYGKGFPFPHDR